jgi:hypothetical protein
MLRPPCGTLRYFLPTICAPVERFRHLHHEYEGLSDLRADQSHHKKQFHAWQHVHHNQQIAKDE